ncbi:substrate-binding domain-containing protein [Ponticoccus sp. SC2-23]|uniref:LacI family DNA-binding transcriptional regulator n=1 Tax=Alexandriicola marinus TaxID=2081710 RepID=UPI000FDBABFE|nr:substrate-binding domain-containing protein [Alexandriicola marinus]MBM1222303.1 substrate-binding domain-containing protein [Ponticoccus sp. SC6-9]MBM1224416.1 substrate-binding domain-containing protein [Ponticoccus sp. SC6-15]MBM1229804.1 substrate-binding domain-containing protein [Ponticoccus sp. SC6-38]MBM1233382.1 substrate-binding domain-containing protein [Ponticoccus sp. SC6-45]MBM1236668.1 substrate-binding domain-containing protein [Ponticoccus sp. SC6-49]MBM1244712.1 substrate
MNLKELSEKLGLSQTTVSRALNGYPEVREATRARVLDAARHYNYSPNSRAKSLATGQSMAIGHVVPTSSTHEMVNPIFADFTAGASQTYARHGYEMVISTVLDGDEEKVYRKLKARGTVDGVLVHAPAMNDQRLSFIEKLGLPYAVHGRVSDRPEPYCWLDVNNRSAFRTATEFLLDLGHRRIALINGREEMDFAYRRRMGYLDALSARRVPPDPQLMLADEMTEFFGYRSAMQLLALPRPPTAFLVSSMISAIGVRRAAEENGLRLGADLSVMTFDDDLSYLRNGADLPIFTAMHSSVREAGRLLAEMLIDLIANPGGPRQTRLLEAELKIGRSTGPVPFAVRSA